MQPSQRHIVIIDQKNSNLVSGFLETKNTFHDSDISRRQVFIHRFVNRFALPAFTDYCSLNNAAFLSLLHVHRDHWSYIMLIRCMRNLGRTDLYRCHANNSAQTRWPLCHERSNTYEVWIYTKKKKKKKSLLLQALIGKNVLYVASA